LQTAGSNYKTLHYSAHKCQLKQNITINVPTDAMQASQRSKETSQDRDADLQCRKLKKHSDETEFVSYPSTNYNTHKEKEKNTV
jgi:hypothetical protein